MCYGLQTSSSNSSRKFYLVERLNVDTCDCQVPPKATPLFSGAGMIMLWNIWNIFINLFLETSSKSLIPLVSIIILLPSFKILSAGLAFSRKEGCWLLSFCKDLLLILECNCAFSKLKHEIILVDQRMVLCGQKICESVNGNKIRDCVLNISVYYCCEICFPVSGR